MRGDVYGIMEENKLFESEYLLCKIIWENEPIKSGKLVEIVEKELGWKPSTTYTVIKRLTKRGILISEKMIVRSLIIEEEAQTSLIREVLDTRFNSSCPAFLAAFSKSIEMTDKDIDDIQKMLDELRKQRES